MVPTIQCVFFDIGGTLGDVDAQMHLHLFPEVPTLLHKLQGLKLRLGVISNVPATMTGADLARMLAEAGLGEVFEPALIIASTDAGSDKPNARIFELAALRANAEPAACLFVGEDLAEVIGARAAGMQSQLAPRRA